MRIHQHRQLQSQLHDLMQIYGYEALDTHIIQPADLFLTKAGDKIINKLFVLERHGKQVALRPEFTAIAAQHYVRQNIQGVRRWQFSGPIFEDNPEQFTQSYQKYSVGAEIIDMGGPLADAEIIAVAMKGVLSQNLKDVQLVIGHAGLLRQLLLHHGLDSYTYRFLLAHREDLQDEQKGKSYVLDQFDQLVSRHYHSSHTIDTPLTQLDEQNTQQMLNVLLDTTYSGTALGGRTRNDIAQRMLRKHARSIEREQVEQAIDLLMRWGQIKAAPHQAFKDIENLISNGSIQLQETLASWKKVIDLLSYFDLQADSIVIHPDLSRNWDYYTGIVFGVCVHNGPFLAGGGRYDDLLRILGSKRNVPAVGFAYYLDTLLELLPSKPSKAKPLSIKLLIDINNLPGGIQLANNLRKHGLIVEIVDTDNYKPDSGIIIAQSAKTALYKDQVYSIDQLPNLVEKIQTT